MEKARTFGRILRLLFGSLLGIIVFPVFLRAGSTYIFTSLGISVALVIFYVLLHVKVMRLAPNINRWIGAVVAVLPVAIVFVLGQGGGIVFGQGEGATGALTFLAISFLIDFSRADSGCEVMAIPGLIFRERTPLACLALTPVDMLEKKLTR